MEISTIKQQLSIQTVLEHYGYGLNQNNMFCCPFHEDDTPSMKIYTATNTFNCFGCGKNGDVIEFCSLKEGSKHLGILKAKELCGVPPNNTTAVSVAVKKDHSPILTKIFEYFKKGLKSPISKKAQEYLQSRNLNPKLLELGYNSGQFHHRGKLNEEELKSCIAAGLLIPYQGNIPKAKSDSYPPFAKDCIIFPLRNKENRIVSFYGRSVTANINNKHYYTPNRQGLYPNYPAGGTRKLILTESIIDATTLLQEEAITKEYCVLSLYGVNGLTTEHTEAMMQLNELAEVILWFDGDEPGRKATIKHGKTLQELLPTIKISIVDTPKGEDINSLLDGHSPEVFLELLKNRKPLFLLPSRQTGLPAGQVGLTEQEIPKGHQKDDKKSTAPCLNISNPELITYQKDTLKFTLLGGINLQQADKLRVTLKINRRDSTNPLHSIRHSLDLYHADYLEKFITRASEQLETGSLIIKQNIMQLTDLLEAYRIEKVESLKTQKPKKRELTEGRKKAAIAYLKTPGLLKRTNEDIGKTGVIGEVNNRLLMYLIFTSRLREQPLHIISLGASGTGKTYLQERVAELIPEHDKLEITILSDNAFYYFDRKELANKLVLIEDMDGAENVLYPLRELMSKKRISKTVTVKDNKGNLKTITLQVEGPICVAGTTTKEKIYEDNANRSILIYGDNSRSHQEEIMNYQRAVSAGQIAHHEEERVKEMFRDMQTVLKPIKVRNPYAEQLKIPPEVFKPLRTNTHYLQFIECITFYHQWQRHKQIDKNTGDEYIETTLEDIEWANQLLKDVLLSKADELSGACRTFFEALKAYLLKGGCASFYAKEIRQSLRISPTTLKRYLYQLLINDYIKIIGGDKYRKGYEYEVVNYKEYSELQNNIKTALDEALERIKEKQGSSPVVHGGPF